MDSKVMSQKGFAAQLLVVTVLVVGLVVGVMLVQKTNILKSQAGGGGPIVIQDSNGNSLPVNNGIPYTSKSVVIISLISPFGTSPKTKSFAIGENPTDLDRAPSQIYAPRDPILRTYAFQDRKPGKHFIWVRFINQDGKKDDRSKEVDIVTPSPTPVKINTPTPKPILTNTPKPSPTLSPIPKLTFGQAADFFRGDKGPNMLAMEVSKTDHLNPTANFTIEAWVDPDKLPKYSMDNNIQSYSPIIVKRLNNTNNNLKGIYGLGLTVQDNISGDPTYQYEFYVRDSWKDCQSDYSRVGRSSTIQHHLVGNKWDHVVLEIKDGYMYLFVNGVRETQLPSHSGKFCSSNNPLDLAADNTALDDPRSFSYNQYFSGKLDEVRISNIARYAPNSSVAFGPEFQVPTAPFQPDNNTLALYHLDGDGKDASHPDILEYWAASVGAYHFISSNAGVPATSSNH